MVLASILGLMPVECAFGAIGVVNSDGKLAGLLDESYSVSSATLLLSITALFREPKAREELQLG
jgi:hypothetical protein